MKTLQEIKQILFKHKQRLFARYPIKSIAVFGSYARNEQQSKSDVDILVDVDGNVGVRFIDLANEIEDIIGIKVDVVSKNAMKHKYYKSIEQDLVYV
ncbi:MAG: nucleotidyltransferase family protein [Bacteroidia bacterium]